MERGEWRGKEKVDNDLDEKESEWGLWKMEAPSSFVPRRLYQGVSEPSAHHLDLVITPLALFLLVGFMQLLSAC